MGQFFFGQQRNVLHGFGMFEQCLARRRQFITLGVLHKQRGAEAFLDGLDMPGHGRMGGLQALGSGEQAPATLQFKEVSQVIPVEHVASPLGLENSAV